MNIITSQLLNPLSRSLFRPQLAAQLHFHHARRFATYFQEPTLRFKQIDADEHTSDTLHVKIPFTAETLDVKLNLSDNLQKLGAELKQLNSHIKDITFYTLDGATIPDFELVSSRRNIPFIMQILRNEGNERYTYAINLSSNYCITSNCEENNKKSEEAYLSYCEGIGLPRYQALLLSNFASKIHESLPSGEKVKTEDIIKGLYTSMSYYRSVGTDKSLLKVSEIERLITDKQAELHELNDKKAALYRKADFRSRALLLLGSSFFIGQWAFIMGGTFVFYSWDVMEPISYIMMFTNFTAGFFFYTSLKKDLELSTVREILSARFARRLY